MEETRMEGSPVGDRRANGHAESTSIVIDSLGPKFADQDLLNSFAMDLSGNHFR